MKDDWHDRAYAETWDSNPLRKNPLREEHLDILVSIIIDGYREGASILDLGMGSGQVEEMIFQRVPNARVVGIDASEVMIEMAAKRLKDHRDRYSVIRHDLRELGTLDLAPNSFQYAISSQVFHELPHEKKREAFAFVQRVLAPGGVFLITDRTALHVGSLYEVYASVWSRLIRKVSRASGGFPEFLKWYDTKEDFPATPQEHVDFLKEAGFEAACLHLHLNRGLFAAEKRGS